MDTPIINPMWIWAIDALTELDLILTRISSASLITLVTGTICIGLWFILDERGWYDGQLKLFKESIKVIRNTVIWTALLLIVATIIPSEKTMYTMMATNYVTEENIDIAGETVTDAIDYIFEKVDMLLEDNE